MEKKNKCVIVIGPESSGTLFICRILVATLGIRKSIVDAKFGNYGSLENDTDKVYHISLPTSPRAVFMDIKEIINAEKKKYKDVHVVICTRDINISEKSRLNRMSFRTIEDVKNHSQKAKEIIADLIVDENIEWFLWSYETFMYLKEDYLKQLFKFLNVSSGITEYPIVDGNVKYLK